MKRNTRQAHYTERERGQRAKHSIGIPRGASGTLPHFKRGLNKSERERERAAEGQVEYKEKSLRVSLTTFLCLFVVVML